MIHHRKTDGRMLYICPETVSMKVSHKMNTSFVIGLWLNAMFSSDKIAPSRLWHGRMGTPATRTHSGLKAARSSPLPGGGPAALRILPPPPPQIPSREIFETVTDRPPAGGPAPYQHP